MEETTYIELEFDLLIKETQKAVLISQHNYTAWIPKSCIKDLNETLGLIAVAEWFDINWKEDKPSNPEDIKINVTKENQDELWEYI